MPLLSLARGLALIALVCASRIAGASEWLQAPRDDGARTPLRVFVPDAGTTCAPLAVISPGAGGSEDGLSYLADSLRESGFVTIVLGHHVSGAGPLKQTKPRKGASRPAAPDMTTDPVAYRDRLLDVGAALKWIGAPACRSTFSVLLGHSMGAATVMIEAGAKNNMGIKGEDRFDAYVAISPQGPGSIFPEHAWTKVHRPVLMLTGTKDQGNEGDWKWRTMPFDDLPNGCKWLGVVNGATHMNFAGAASSAATQKAAILALNNFLDSVRSNCVMPPPKAKGINFKAK